MSLYRSTAPAALLVSCLALPPATAGAQSACTPAAPANGDAVTCAATGTGIVDGSFDDGTVTVEAGATVTGAAQGFLFDDNVTFVNNGTVTGLGDHGVQGDNGVTVTNNGTITGAGGDGVNIDNDGTLVNNGTITSTDDDGVQLEDNPTVINNGTITAVDEGINVNVANAVVTNTGTVLALDDAINAGENATITNSGTIRSNGPDQDGIDLDSGTIVNTGFIISDATADGDGIDFDAGAAAPSTVTNSGTISGVTAINTDPADTQSQTVINSGTMIGTGGTAVNLGGGDDALVLENGSRITGLIDLGAGNDTLTVNGSDIGVLSFGTAAPEVVDGTVPVLISGLSALIVDTAALAPLAAGDGLALDLGTGIGGAVLDAPRAAGAEATQDTTADSRGMAASVTLFGSAFERDRTGGVQGHERRSGGVVLSLAPYGTGVSWFAAFGSGTTQMDDGLHEARQDALVLGIAAQGPLGATGRYGATLFAGATETDFDGPLSGTASGTMAGFSAQVAQDLRGGFDMVGRIGWVNHAMDGYTLGTGATVDSRGASRLGLRAELGHRFAAGAGQVRPFLLAVANSDVQDDISATFGAASASAGAADMLSDGGIGLGVSYSGALEGGALDARAEVLEGGDGAARVSVSVRFGMRF